MASGVSNPSLQEKLGAVVGMVEVVEVVDEDEVTPRPTKKQRVDQVVVEGCEGAVGGADGMPDLPVPWTPLRLIDEPFEHTESCADRDEGLPRLQLPQQNLPQQYVVCTEDVETSGRFFADVIDGGVFLGTIKNQTTLKAALAKISILGTLIIVGHSDDSAGYICKGKVLISKALSLAAGKVHQIVFLMCYSSEMARRSYNITQTKLAGAMQAFREKRVLKAGVKDGPPPRMEIQGFVGIGHGCSTSAWGDEEELDLVSSVALLTKALARWPGRKWSEIARMVSLPTSDSMDESDSSTVTFTCGMAFGECTVAPCVVLSTQNLRRLLDALQILRRELYQDNPLAALPCGDEIV